MTVSAADRDPSIAAGTFVNNLGRIRWAQVRARTADPARRRDVPGRPRPDGRRRRPHRRPTASAIPCTGADRDETPGEFETPGRPGRHVHDHRDRRHRPATSRTRRRSTAQVTSPMAAPYTANAGQRDQHPGRPRRGSSTTATAEPPRRRHLHRDRHRRRGARLQRRRRRQHRPGRLRRPRHRRARPASSRSTDLKLGTYQVVEKTAPAGYIRQRHPHGRDHRLHGARSRIPCRGSTPWPPLAGSSTTATARSSAAPPSP